MIANHSISIESLLKDPNSDQWTELAPGVRMLILHEHPSSGYRVALLKYEPGTSTRRHIHTGDEHIFVLEGSQSDENGHYPKGSYVVNPKGREHKVYSQEGCVVLIHWIAPVQFIEEGHS